MDTPSSLLYGKLRTSVWQMVRRESLKNGKLYNLANFVSVFIFIERFADRELLPESRLSSLR
jgi:hypothetical protein